MGINAGLAGMVAVALVVVLLADEGTLRGRTDGISAVKVVGGDLVNTNC